MAKLKVGSKVKCQYFNTPDNRFYGNFFTGEILSIVREKSYYTPPKQFVLKRDDDSRIITVARKEIKKILS